jgi:ribonuclease P protein component
MNNTFPKKEHLCLKRRFETLLAQGKSFFIYPFRVIYLISEPGADGVPLQAAISVRKKQFKRAVTRNLIKRRFRESWRQRKQLIQAGLAAKEKSLYVLFVYGATEVLPYSEIDARLALIIKRLDDITGATAES